MIEKIKELAKEILKDVDTFMGYERGFDPLHATPLFVRNEKDIERLIFDVTSVHNLASFLPYMKKRVGIIVKGCDSRTVIQLLQEELIKRENVVILGVPCNGILNVKKLMRELEFKPVFDLSHKDAKISVKYMDGEKTLLLEDFLSDKCKTCLYPTPLLYDYLASDPISSNKEPGLAYKDILEFEEKSLDQRFSFWKEELGKCIRCYACRNACPMCICRDSCIAETREPKWVSQRATLEEKFMFHMIHAIHLAGRCVECGECERACPMNIPLLKIRKKINLELNGLFDYEPGTKLEEKPPMFTFKVEEERIKEPEI